MIAARPTRPTHDYSGPRKWAEDHAARLQGEVGVVRGDIVITAVTAQRYGESLTAWAVVEKWQYLGQGHLGTYTRYLTLPL